MSEVKLVIFGIDYPHTKAWLQTILQVPETRIVGMVRGKYEGKGDPMRAAPVPPIKGEISLDVPIYDSIDEALRGVDFDAGWVMLSNEEKPDVCCKLAEAGKHIFAEKPVTRSAAEMSAIVEAVERYGVKFQSGYAWRFSPLIRELHARAAGGDFGRLYGLQILLLTSTVRDRGSQHFLFNKSISGGGMFHWLGCHSIDLALLFFGHDVEAVTAWVGTIGGSPVDVEDGGSAVIEFRNGAVAALTCGYYLRAGATKWTYVLEGEEGWAEWVLPSEEVRLLSVRETGGKEQTLRFEAPDVPGYGGALGLELVRNFVEAVRNDGETVCTALDALRVLKIIEAVYESSSSGRRVFVGL